MDLNKFHVTLSLTSKFLIKETGFSSSSFASTTTASSFLRMRLRVDPIKGTFKGGGAWLNDVALKWLRLGRRGFVKLFRFYLFILFSVVWLI